jgi:hypothetical protein
VAVSDDGRGLVSQAGVVLLWETMRVTGLGRGLSEGLARWRAPRAVHDPGKIVADLAAAVALGGDCLSDIAVLREQPALAGPVASDPVVSHLVSTLPGTCRRRHARVPELADREVAAAALLHRHDDHRGHGKAISSAHSRKERWGRLVKRAGLAGASDAEGMRDLRSVSGDGMNGAGSAL